MWNAERMGTPIYLEVGRKRVFAAAFDWPGWCRSGRDEPAAIAALATYAPRYAVVVAAAGLALPSAPDDFDVVERLPGTATTEFGAPGVIADRDRGPASAAEAGRAVDLLEAGWTVLGRVAAAAPAELRKGPRGGGRDRDKILDHVEEAELGYARLIGLKLRMSAAGDRSGVAANRAAIAKVLRGGESAESLRWPLPYATRRIAWHALDHAWEIEDRSAPAPA